MISSREVDKLWAATKEHRGYPDEQVNVKYVSEEEIRELNKRYRNKNEVTNVLTFSYADPLPFRKGEQNAEHDIALCLEVAEREAQERGVEVRDYIALLLVHAFLHATGLDHEESEAKAREMEKAEREILEKCGYKSESL